MGALTSKPFSFIARSWELYDRIAYDFSDTFFSGIKVSFRGGNILRILPEFVENSVREWISDRARFSYDSTSGNIGSDIFLGLSVFFTESWVTFYFKRFQGYCYFSNFDSIDMFFSGVYRGITSFTGGITSFLERADFRKNFYFDLHKNFEDFPFRNFFIIGINFRYQVPVYTIKLRKIKSGKSNMFFFNFGFFTNNLLGEYNLGSSISSFFRFSRGNLRSSRLINVPSVFFANNFMFNIFSNFFSGKTVHILTSSPAELAFSEISSFFVQRKASFFNFVVPNQYSSSYINIKSSSYFKFEGFTNASSPSLTMFDTFKEFRFSEFYLFNKFKFLSKIKFPFSYNNFYTHFNNSFSRRSIYVLVSLKRQSDARVNFFYYN